MNLNKAFLIGNLTRNPELKSLPSGMAVTSFGLATNRVWKNQQGQKQEEVQFHNIVVFGRQAEIVSQYLSKGSLVFIEGRIRTRTWEGQDKIKRYTTEIIAERIQFGPRTVARKEEAAQQFPAAAANNAVKNELPEINIDEEEIKPEDLPF